MSYSTIPRVLAITTLIAAAVVPLRRGVLGIFRQAATASRQMHQRAAALASSVEAPAQGPTAALTGTPTDAPVIATNDDAFETKIAAMERGYFSDPFLSAMKQMRPSHLSAENHLYRRQPVINRGTYARVLIKSRLLSSFIRQAASNKTQVISLGAGFDTFPFSLFSTSPARHLPLRYVELDLSPVVKEKIHIGQHFLTQGTLFSSVQVKNDNLHATLSKFASSTTSTSQSSHPNYSLCACDLRDLSSLTQVFVQAGIDPTAPTVIIAEIALVYMEPRNSDAVINHLSKWFTGLRSFINIEHVAKGDQFGHQMDLNIAARGCPLLGMRQYPDMDAQRKRFIQLGWPHCSVNTMLHWFHALVSRDEVIKLQRIEFLDELEEWNMLMEHYCVVTASAGEQSRTMTESWISQLDEKSVA